MIKSVLPAPILKNELFALLVIISIVIALSSALINFSLYFLSLYFALSLAQELIFQELLLVGLNAPLLWWFALRPLQHKLANKSAETAEQFRRNAELRAVLDIHALVSITDKKGNIIYVNDKFCTVSGYSTAELIGRNHRIVKSGYHDPAYMENMWRTISSGKHWQGEFCNRRKDGGLYWVDNTIAPLLDERGKPKQYISIRRDITELKTYEAKLMQLKHALDNSHEMIFITNANGCIDYVNHALCEFTGWQKSALIGQQPRIFDTPKTDLKTLAVMQQNLKKCLSWSGRLLNRRLDIFAAAIAEPSATGYRDYWADINITPLLDANGAMSGYVQIQRDISELVAQEAALQQEAADTSARLAIALTLQQHSPIKERLAKVLEILFGLEGLAPHIGGIFLHGDTGQYLESYLLSGQFSAHYRFYDPANPVSAYLSGLTAISNELIIFDNCQCEQNPKQPAPAGKSHGHYLAPIIADDNILGFLLLFTERRPNQNDTRKTMLTRVGIMIALALLQEQTQSALAMARDAALKTSQTKSEFLANMSHEIRTPMNGVLGMLDMLKDTVMSPEQYDLVDTAANSAEALLAIINDILDFSKLEAGKIELEDIRFDLPVLVEEVCALQAARAHDKALDLNCYIAVDLPKWWQGDPSRLRQVLLNLVGNAIKFTERGEVSVSVSALPASEHAYSLNFEVKDSGIGISPAQQARLFQPFSQADSSTARRFGGTGLGLSISRNLVQIMGGVIGVESAASQGSCFWFKLPLTIADQNGAETQRQELAGKRVLVVDDNQTNRNILEHYLRHWGMSVNLVSSGTEALAALQTAAENRQAFDLLLFDLHMPNMDGLSMVRAINELPAIKAIPRLLLSSGGVVPDTDIKALGIAQSMLKPVRKAQLLQAILHALQLISPLAGANQSNAKYKNLNTVPSYSAKRLLVAEDNAVNRKVILARLAKYGIQADVAENGRTALDLLTDQPYDLVLMDCQMPIMDGYEATRRLRGREISHHNSHIPIIALTAHADAGAREFCLSAGMDDYLSKPINPQELTKLLLRWLGPGDMQASSGFPQSDASEKPNVHRDEIACWNRAKALKFLEDDAELLCELMQLFIENAPIRLTEMHRAQTEQDYVKLANAAHAIKGMTSSFFAESATAWALKLESSAQKNQYAECGSLCLALTTATQQLILAFQRQLHPGS
jgi:PAS domain S-box-containing protein